MRNTRYTLFVCLWMCPDYWTGFGGGDAEASGVIEKNGQKSEIRSRGQKGQTEKVN